MTIEELQEQLLQEQESKKELQTRYDALKNENDELTKSNAKLVEYNNKLFMRVSEPAPQQERQKPQTAEELENNEIEAIKKLMKEREY